MNIEFHFLANRPQHLPQLAQWYFAEWGELTQAASVHTVEARLQEYLNADKIPVIILAENAGELVGAVQLKFREMTIFPDKEHWLGGVYVAEKYRNNKIAAQLVKRAMALASEMDVKALYLQTIRLDGGLYRKLGWKAVDKVIYRNLEVLVMVNNLK